MVVLLYYFPLILLRLTNLFLGIVVFRLPGPFARSHTCIRIPFLPLNASIALIHSQHQKASPPLSSSTLGTIIIVDLIGNYWAQPGFADPTCSQSILDRPHRPPLPVRLGDETNDDHSHTHTIILRSNSTHQYTSAHILNSPTVTTTATATAGPSLPLLSPAATLYDNTALKRAQYPSWSSVAPGGP